LHGRSYKGILILIRRDNSQVAQFKANSNQNSILFVKAIMNNNLIRIIIIFVAAFLCPNFSFAIQIDKLEIGGHDAANLDYIEIHQEDLVEVKKQVWETASKFSIAVEGNLFPSTDTSKVQYSIDGGMGFRRAKGENPFYFTFAPLDGNTYPVIIKFFNKLEEVIFTKEINVKYTALDWTELFKDKVEKIRLAYVDKELNTFISFFDDGEYSDFFQFKDDIKSTFDDNSKLSLSITVKSVEVKEDTAIVVLDWHRTFEDDSYQSGSNQTINFKEKDGVWKITSVSDDAIFIVGTGKLTVIY